MPEQLEAFRQPIGEIEPRVYQVQAFQNLRRAFSSGKRRVLLQAGTGAGKTIIACMVMDSLVKKGNPGIFLAHRRELIHQCSRKLYDFGIPHGVMMAGEMPLESRQMQVASIQTLWHRGVIRDRIELPPASLLVIDEAHRSMAKTYLHLIDAYSEALVLGLSATPCRKDGRGLGEVYEQMVSCPSLTELINEGYLVPTRFFAPSIPDLKGVKVRAGDYVEEQLAEKMDRPELVGDVIEQWALHGGNRKTVVFASSVEHSIHLARAFCSSGVAADHLDGNTPIQERDQMLRKLSDGDLQVVCNCQVLTEGWDQPDVGCVVLARPTRSIVLYLQMVGRGMRPWPGKRDLIVIDHSGALYEHGFPEEKIRWSLDPSEKVVNEVQEQRAAKEARPICCPECSAVYVGRAQCPECGHTPKRRPSKVAYVDAQLGEVPRKGETQSEATIREKERWYAMLLGHARNRGYKPGWAYYAYKERFGKNPPTSIDRSRSVDPSPDVRAFITHLNIKRAKAREREEKHSQQNMG